MVIGILATIALVAYNGIQQRARVAVLQSDLKNASTKLEIDNVNNSTYPASETVANGGQGLKASPGTTWQYAYTSADNSYCLTGTNSGVSYFVSNDNSTPQSGACTGHVDGGGGEIAFDQPNDCPTGFIPVPGNNLFSTQGGFCTMKYEAKNVGGTATSQAAEYPWVSISQTDAMTTSSAACSGCHLISEAEWLTIAHNVLGVDSNWSGGTVGSGYIYSGHNDNNPANALAADTNDTNGYYGTSNVTPSNQRRTLTLTNGEVIWDMVGNVYDWTAGQTSGGQPGASGYTWRQWNTIAGTGSLSPNPHPNYGTPAASDWTTGHGIGRVLSSSTDTSLRGFLRGGSWSHGSIAGVLTLSLYNSPGGTGSSPGDTPGAVGFRVAR